MEVFNIFKIFLILLKSFKMYLISLNENPKIKKKTKKIIH